MINEGSEIMSFSLLIMVMSMVIVGLIWKRKKNSYLDQAIKPVQKTIYDNLSDPFNRKKDDEHNDDDFDKML